MSGIVLNLKGVVKFESQRVMIQEVSMEPKGFSEDAESKVIKAYF